MADNHPRPQAEGSQPWSESAGGSDGWGWKPKLTGGRFKEWRRDIVEVLFWKVSDQWIAACNCTFIAVHKCVMPSKTKTKTTTNYSAAWVTSSRQIYEWNKIATSNDISQNCPVVGWGGRSHQDSFNLLTLPFNQHMRPIWWQNLTYG